MKKYKRIVAFVLFLFILLSLSIMSTPAKAADDPEILASSAILVETKTGKVLYALNENTRSAPASLTKIMTVMLAIEACERGDISLDDVVTIPVNAYFDVTADGSTLGILPGEEMKVEDLLYAALMASANEACNTLAEYVSGDVASFLTLMNKRAKELGCTDTHFANTHGLPSNNHYSTAHDLYLISDAAMRLPLFAQIVGTESYTIPATNKSDVRIINNTNQLLDKDSAYYLKNATGVKTGYTDAAGFCLISAAENDDLSLLSVVLGAKSVVIEDGTTQVQSFSESNRLLKWGFSNFSYKKIIGTLDLLAEIPVQMGRGCDSVVLRPAENVIELLDNDVDISTADIETVIFSENSKEKLVAPLSQGDVLGSATITLNGTSYGPIDLVANTSVELDKGAYMLHRIKSTLKNPFVIIGIVLIILFFAGYIMYVVEYNRKRQQERALADEMVRKRIEELRRGESLTTGKSFEEIEELQKNRH